MNILLLTESEQEVCGLLLNLKKTTAMEPQRESKQMYYEA